MKSNRTPRCLVVLACGPWAVSKKAWDTQEERALVRPCFIFSSEQASRSVVVSWVRNWLPAWTPELVEGV